MKRRLSLLVILALMLFALPAGANVTEKYVFPVENIAISRTNAVVSVGQTFTLQTRITPSSRAHEMPVWKSDNPQVASVSEGVVTAKSPGLAYVSASLDGQSAICAVQVKKAVVKGIRLSRSTLSLSPGDTFPLEIAAYNPAYAREEITWTSQNSAIASIDENTGLITAHKVGVTRVRARTAGGKMAYCTVTVSASVRAKGITISPTGKNFSYGESRQLTAVVSPSNAVPQDQIVTWKSSNPSIAQVSDTGLVTAGDKPGSVTITATTGNGRTAKLKITVKYMAVRNIALSQSKVTLSSGETARLTATLSPFNATDSQVIWQSSNPDIAAVDGGLITAHQSGTARITATAGGKTADCLVYVRSIQAHVTITAAGDITIGGDIRRQNTDPASEAWYEKLYKKYSGNFLDKVSDYFSGANEITLVNLESNLTTATQYKNKAYVLRADPSYVKILSRAGVDVVGHANNHSADYGTMGAKHTKNAVTGAGMSYVNGAMTAIRQANGVSVGFCAFNQTGGNVTAAMQTAVKALKAKCDIVVVSIHWGSEFVYTTSAQQRNLGRAAINAGADLVVGHHSHVVSGVEKYKNRYIVYGLGTLSSSIATPEDMDAILFRQTFKVDVQHGDVEPGAAKLIPVSMSTDDSTPHNVNDAKPYVLSGAARKRVLNKVKYYSRPFAQTLPEECFQ